MTKNWVLEQSNIWKSRRKKILKTAPLRPPRKRRGHGSKQKFPGERSEHTWQMLQVSQVRQELSTDSRIRQRWGHWWPWQDLSGWTGWSKSLTSGALGENGKRKEEMVRIGTSSKSFAVKRGEMVKQERRKKEGSGIPRTRRDVGSLLWYRQ